MRTLKTVGTFLGVYILVAIIWMLLAAPLIYVTGDLDIEAKLGWRKIGGLVSPIFAFIYARKVWKRSAGRPQRRRETDVPAWVVGGVAALIGLGVITAVLVVGATIARQ